MIGDGGEDVFQSDPIDEGKVTCQETVEGGNTTFSPMKYILLVK